MKINLFTITSSLHDRAAVENISDSFLESLHCDFDIKGEHFEEFGTCGADIIYIRTGGAEGIFKSLLPNMLEKGVRHFNLLASGKSNSLAASLEILSFLRQEGLSGEVLHGSPEYIKGRIDTLAAVAEAMQKLQGARIGVVGKPSDWLIASGADREAVFSKTGITFEDIPMSELLEEIARCPKEEPHHCCHGGGGCHHGEGGCHHEEGGCHHGEGECCHHEEGEGHCCHHGDGKNPVKEALPGALQILDALAKLVSRHRLDALTLRCFDLLDTVKNTGCLALATLNSRGIPSSCEGDLPALLSMMIARAVTGHSGFQANPSRIDVEKGEILFAHCTVPFDIITSATFDTHFESGIGVGIHGELPEGPVTVFKVSGDLGRCFIAEGTLTANQYEDNLCRTQVRVSIPPEKARYFLTDPIGNHHIVIPGHYGPMLSALLSSLL